LKIGKTQHYPIDVKAGDYLCSCPLNATPDCRLIVTGASRGAASAAQLRVE